MHICSIFKLSIDIIFPKDWHVCSVHWDEALCSTQSQGEIATPEISMSEYLSGIQLEKIWIVSSSAWKQENHSYHGARNSLENPLEYSKRNRWDTTLEV